MNPQGEKTVYGSVPLLGKFCLLSRGLAELGMRRKRRELDATTSFGNDCNAEFGGFLNALG
jgi:hypothetical protein